MHDRVTQRGRGRVARVARFVVWSSIACGGPPAESTAGEDTSDPASSVTTGGVDDSSGGTTSGTTDTSGASVFIQAPDGGPGYDYECLSLTECDLWSQDCRSDERCVPWKPEGEGTFWSCARTRCVPLHPDPVVVGGVCTTEDRPWSGVDDCGVGSFCWSVDPSTLEGVCAAPCLGNRSEAMCDDPMRACFIGFDGLIVTCVPGCDPLAPMCGDGDVCTFNADEPAVCLPSEMVEPRLPGDRCADGAGCGEGLACVSHALVPGCEPPWDCCAVLCDLAAPACDPRVPACTPVDGAAGAAVCTIE